jgi:hypothetical protein
MAGDDVHEDDRRQLSTPGPRPVPGPRPAPAPGGAGSAAPAASSTTEPVDRTPSAGGDGVASTTGDPAVDQALTRLAELDALPVREHVAVFDAVHAALQDRLADVED